MYIEETYVYFFHVAGSKAVWQKVMWAKLPKPSFTYPSISKFFFFIFCMNSNESGNKLSNLFWFYLHLKVKIIQKYHSTLIYSNQVFIQKDFIVAKSVSVNLLVELSCFVSPGTVSL